MITRRQILKGAAALAVGACGLSGYAFAVEPYRLNVRRYRVTPANWPAGQKLRIVALADIHTCEPWMPADRVREIVEVANRLEPDLCVLLGDFVAGHRLVRASVPKADWTGHLADIAAPLGTYAILGNHDWWEDRTLQVTRQGPTPVGRALEAVGIPVLENDGLRLEKDGKPFWLLGLGDQWAFYLNRHRQGYNGRFGFEGVDDLEATLAKIKDDAPAILMIHEPDAFVDVPERISLTLAGHTHGGQVQFMGWAPRVPSRFGQRYVYGHIVEPVTGIAAGAEAGGAGLRNMIVSGGLGCSGLPIRFGRPPEITVVDLGGGDAVDAG